MHNIQLSPISCVLIPTEKRRAHCAHTDHFLLAALSVQILIIFTSPLRQLSLLLQTERRKQCYFCQRQGLFMCVCGCTNTHALARTCDPDIWIPNCFRKHGRPAAKSKSSRHICFDELQIKIRIQQ